MTKQQLIQSVKEEFDKEFSNKYVHEISPQIILQFLETQLSKAINETLDAVRLEERTIAKWGDDAYSEAIVHSSDEQWNEAINQFNEREAKFRED